MSNYRYWKWQVLRNAPLVIAVFCFVMASGLALLRALPQRQTAQSRVVLETPLALNTAPRATRSSQDIQHLQVVMHRILSLSSLEEMSNGDETLKRADLEIKITSGRDKPTNLTITAHGPTADLARQRVKTLASSAILASNAIQRQRVEASLANLKVLIETEAKTLANAQQNLSRGTFPDQATYNARISNLDLQAKRLEARLAGQPTLAAISNPALATLEAELAKAKIIYSDKHPKVRLLHKQIQQLPHPAPLDLVDMSATEERLADLRAKIAAIASAQSNYEALILKRDDARSRLKKAKAALIEARLRGERSVAQLKLVEDATLLSASRQKKQLALIATLVGLAAALGFGASVLRIRTDSRLRRPADLTKTLGLTPFATIPNLGPRLT